MTHTAHIQALRREADEIIWQRADSLLKNIKAKIGCPALFAKVITDYCAKTPKQSVVHGNLDETIAAKVDEAMITCRNNKQEAAKMLGRSRWWLYDNLRRRGMLVLFLSAFSFDSFAQRGTMSFISATTSPVQAFKQTYLTWDNPTGASNRVSWGLVRGAWTNGVQSITTNSFPITNGWAYKVTAIVDGVESVPALWPSNRIAELWLRGMGTNFSGGTNIVRLVQFTNNPPGNMQFWGVANVTTGWE